MSALAVGGDEPVDLGGEVLDAGGLLVEAGEEFGVVLVLPSCRNVPAARLGSPPLAAPSG
jgi:hypothetical protein